MKRIALALALASSATAFADKAAPPPKESKADVKADYDMTCNAVKLSGADSIKNQSERAKKLADYIIAHLKTEEVKKFLGTLGSMAPADKKTALKKAAADAGYSGTCPLADEK